MRSLVVDYTNRLLQTFRRRSHVVDDKRLRDCYDRKDYVGMLGMVKYALLIECPIMMAIVNSGGLSSPAWVRSVSPFPSYGSTEYKNLLIEMYFRRDFLESASYESVVFAMAHEGCHIVLDGVAHQLRYKEEAVDLLAMILGFSEYYRHGVHQRIPVEQSRSVQGSFIQRCLSFLDSTYRAESTVIRRLGYLTQEEVEFAYFLIHRK